MTDLGLNMWSCTPFFLRKTGVVLRKFTMQKYKKVCVLWFKATDGYYPYTVLWTTVAVFAHGCKDHHE